MRRLRRRVSCVSLRCERFTSALADAAHQLGSGRMARASGLLAAVIGSDLRSGVKMCSHLCDGEERIAERKKQLAAVVDMSFEQKQLDYNLVG